MERLGSARTHRTSALHSSPPSGRPTGKSAGGGVGGSWPGAVEQNRGPHLTAVLLIPRCTVYRFPPAAARWAASHFRCTVYRPGPTAGPPSHLPPPAASSPSVPPWGPRFKNFRHTAAPIAPRLCSPTVLQPL